MNLPQNSTSIRGKKQNLLDALAKPFKTNYRQSVDRINRKSSMHNLAGTVYSDKYNQTFTPSKSRLNSTIDPENLASSVSMKGLNIRASHIPNFSDLNTQLLINKHKLEQHIIFLKQEIAKENRKNNRAETNWKHYANQKQYTQKSAKLQQNIAEVISQNRTLRHQIHELQEENQIKNAEIDTQQKLVSEWSVRVTNLKNNLMVEEKLRNNLKLDLISEQRIMASSSIVQKEREEERAMMLIDINDKVSRNKLN